MRRKTIGKDKFNASPATPAREILQNHKVEDSTKKENLVSLPVLKKLQYLKFLKLLQLLSLTVLLWKIHRKIYWYTRLKGM